MMLRVASSARPDCDKLLNIIKKYRNNAKSFQNTQLNTDCTNLLGTIKVPKNLLNFDNKLPQANYIKTAPSLQNLDQQNRINTENYQTTDYNDYLKHQIGKTNLNPVLNRNNLVNNINQRTRLNNSSTQDRRVIISNAQDLNNIYTGDQIDKIKYTVDQNQEADYVLPAVNSKVL
jgi:hypothetical protein